MTRRVSSWMRRDGLETRMEPVHLVQELGQERHLPKVLDREQAGAQAVVDVVGVVGDVVGERRRLRLRAGEAVEPEGLQGVVFQDRAGNAAAARSAASARRLRLEQRPVVLDEALQRLPGEVQPVEGGVAALQAGDDAQRLGVVVEAAVSAPCRRRARPRPYGRRGCGRGRGTARGPPPDPRRGRASGRAPGRSG